MNSDKWSKNHLNQAITLLRKSGSSNAANAKKHLSSIKLAMKTLRFLELCIEDLPSDSSLDQVLSKVQLYCKVLIKAATVMLINSTRSNKVIITNTTQRVMSIVRNEFNYFSTGDLVEQQRNSLTSKMFLRQQNNSDKTTLSSKKDGETIKESILAMIDEIQMELDGSDEKICSEALKHFAPGDIILTVGYSNTVKSILKTLHNKNQIDKIQVVLIDGDNAQNLYKQLKDEQVQVTLLPMSNVNVAMEQGVNKVLLGAHLVFGNGDVRTAAGSMVAALCAKQKNIPVIVASGVHKFCPVFSGHTESFDKNPEEAIIWSDDVDKNLNFFKNICLS